ncbi:MAG: ADP-ribosylglycohydrolase family protein [Anaerolineae bacterium]|nr:ADP-ribosylglycohydrolase family protein [Anaerolineae bacterium]
MRITKQLLQDELAQRREEGADVDLIEPEVATADPDDEGVLAALYSRLEELGGDANLAAAEPSELEAIREQRGPGPRAYAQAFSETRLADRLYGAWLGRAAGCLLGKPCEGWSHDRIRAYLEPAFEYPLRDYFPLVIPDITGSLLQRARPADWFRGRIGAAPRDDDTDYTVLGLHLIEEHGFDFTTEAVAEEWLSHLPFWQVYTAERVAYANLVNGLKPPDTALYLNPYREWIGAQIRADIFGYVCPGRPEAAAALAYRDARLSHARNGIYGEMWAAACLAAAFVEDDARSVIEVGLSEIPRHSRLATALSQTLAWSDEDDDWQQTWERVNASYGHYHAVHTINNACAVALALLHAEGDFQKAITIAVMCGWDTDCNGATAGSIAGAMLGASSLPARWTAPLNDTLHSAVQGFEVSRLSDLAERTLALARRAL